MRLSVDKVIAATRAGRATRWSLTDAGLDALAAWSRRMRRDRDWDGLWVTVTATVPESERNLRRRLRERMSELGFGSPRPGLWIAPGAAAEASSNTVLDELGLADRSLCWVGRVGTLHTAADLVRRSWDLTALPQHYTDFIATVHGPRPLRVSRPVRPLSLPPPFPDRPRPCRPVLAARIAHGRVAGHPGRDIGPPARGPVEAGGAAPVAGTRRRTVLGPGCRHLP
jgi:hypothetical protein